MAMEGSIIADRYIINGIIGSGGMAIVYRGYDRDTGEEVAIKVLRSEFMQDEGYVRRFEKESQIAIKYSHKNIVKTLEVGCKDGRHYIVMEFVPGKTLKEFIAKQGRLKPPEVVRIGRQICDALFYAHSHQLIHRDIKPQNILLTTEGVVKVADFGIAKAPETSTVTISGSNVLGSVHYISPEQARGGMTDEKADIYSIGIVLYEMVTGTVPFTGDTAVAVALKHLQDAPRPPREIVPETPKALELVILKAISKEQPARYDNAREMARDLERSILEPEGSYVKIRQPDEVDGTRPMHPIKPENLQMQQAGMYSSYSNTGPSRRALPPRPENTWRRKRNPPAVMNVLLAVLLAVVLLGGAYVGIKALINSTAPRLVKMPDLVKQDADMAKQQLDNLGLRYKTDEKPSDQFTKGLISDQSPAKDELVSVGDTVQLTISSGRQQAQVPDVSTLTQADATDKIEKAGLRVGDVRNKVSDKPEGTVVQQEPAANEMLELNSTVNIWLSQAAPTSVLEMPNVFGKTKDVAVAYLSDMGITVSKIIPQTSSYIANTVIGQSPDVGTKMTSTIAVELYVSNGIPPGYNKQYSTSFDVTADNTTVKIVFVDGDKNTTVYNYKLNKGHADPTITLDSMTLGDKTLIYYFNDEEVKRETVTFVAEDAFANAG
jgi:eukaryotic-like serine/threonine-protein kinase